MLGYEESNLFLALNDYRVQSGLSPLRLNTQLIAAARWMAADLGKNAYWSHVDLFGRTPAQRATEFGFFGSVLGENLAAGPALGSDILALWQASPGHNANLLYAGYSVCGIARVYVPGSPYGFYWVIDLGGAV